MATIWDISTFHELTGINSGYQFANGDIIQASHINNALENTGWLKEKIEDIETDITTNYKLYNHAVCLQLIVNSSASTGNLKIYWVNLYLQDNCNQTLNSTRLLTELARIRQTRHGYPAYMTHCSFAYHDGMTPTNSYIGVGVLMVYDNKVVLRNTTGTLLFDSTATDADWASLDTVTQARQNS